jgi:NAD+ kinase
VSSTDTPITEASRQFKYAALIGKPNAPYICASFCLLADFLKARGTAFCLETETARFLGIHNYPILTPQEIGHRSDVAIVLGGDGMMLGIARQLAPFNIPLIGINHGRLGFMTDVALEEMIPTLDTILRGECESEYRSLLDATIFRGENVVFQGVALNDVVIARKARIGLIELGISVNHHFMSRQRADGVIISSPTGSTAYGLAAGGPILHPSLCGIALTPIAPQALSNRPIIVREDARLEVTVLSGREATANFDMQSFADVHAGDRIVVTRSDHRVTFLHPKGWNYYDTLRNKLHWHEFPSADGSL